MNASFKPRSERYVVIFFTVFESSNSVITQPPGRRSQVLNAGLFSIVTTWTAERAADETDVLTAVLEPLQDEMIGYEKPADSETQTRHGVVVFLKPEAQYILELSVK